MVLEKRNNIVYSNVLFFSEYFYYEPFTQVLKYNILSEFYSKILYESSQLRGGLDLEQQYKVGQIEIKQVLQLSFRFCECSYMRQQRQSNDNEKNLQKAHQKIDKQQIETQSHWESKAKFLDKLRGFNLNHNLYEKVNKVNEYLKRRQNVNDKPCDLICPICLQIFIQPVTTVCGHSFCLRCLDQILLLKQECPSCRHSLRGQKLVKCDSLKKIIQKTIRRCSFNEIQTYQQCQEQSTQWTESRKLDLQKICLTKSIDIRDTEHIWCKGNIKQIYIKNNKPHSILIHYQGWNSIYDEIIELTSDRLAASGFYTDRKDIPHYIANENQQRMYSYVVNERDQQSNMDLNNINFNPVLEEDLYDENSYNAVQVNLLQQQPVQNSNNSNNNLMDLDNISSNLTMVWFGEYSSNVYTTGYYSADQQRIVVNEQFLGQVQQNNLQSSINIHQDQIQDQVPQSNKDPFLSINLFENSNNSKEEQQKQQVINPQINSNTNIFKTVQNGESNTQNLIGI